MVKRQSRVAIVDRATLINFLSPPLDAVLCGQLLDDFVSMERRYVLRDWEPATLDGGQFCEAASSLIYHQDSATINRRKGVDECLKYVEDPNNSNTHHFPKRKAALHLCRVIRTIYKLRSDRGAVHIDPEYTANHLDAKLVLDNSRWVLSEILRVFWTGGCVQVAATIRELVQYDVPVIGVFEGRPLVQRTDCSVEEEILLILHYAGENGMSRAGIGRSVMKSPSAVTNTLKSLASGGRRQIVQLSSGNYRLTDAGIRRVLSQLADKMSL